MAREDRPFGQDPAGVANRLFMRVCGIVGPNVARMSIRHFSQKRLSLEPDQVGKERATELCEALRPLLRSMIGQVQADKLVRELQSELSK